MQVKFVNFLIPLFNVVEKQYFVGIFDASINLVEKSNGAYQMVQCFETGTFDFTSLENYDSELPLVLVYYSLFKDFESNHICRRCNWLAEIDFGSLFMDQNLHHDLWLLQVESHWC